MTINYFECVFLGRKSTEDKIIIPKYIKIIKLGIRGDLYKNFKNTNIPNEIIAQNNDT